MGRIVASEIWGGLLEEFFFFFFGGGGLISRILQYL